jgi:HlyD family secretion protein/epimerase transport system membrane fusion protein
MIERIANALVPVRNALGTMPQGSDAGLPVPGLPDPSTPPLMHVLRGPIRAGVLLVGLFFGGIGWWAATAPLAGAAIAPGVVSPDGSRRTVQHLEGGIIREILVDDGSMVRAGDPLIVLEDVQARAGFDALQTRFYTLAATQARLLAEQAQVASVRFPDWLVQATTDHATALEAMVAQRALFDTRAKALDDRKGILRQRIQQLREEIAGLEAQIDADSRQIALIDEEIEGVEQLYRKGLERKSRLLTLKRTRTDIEGDRAEKRARIARAEQAIGETELQINAQDTAQLEAINEEAGRVQFDLAEVEQQLAASRDVLERTLITAPTDGTVVGLRFRTPGGVIRPGEPVLEIVPNDEELLVDARLSPMDIDTVRAGLPARIVLPAFQQRHMPQIHGRVRRVSADAITDPQSGQRFYELRVEVDRAELAALAPEIKLTPGMPAEVYVTTGERTVLDYLLSPFYRSLGRAFREN